MLFVIVIKSFFDLVMLFLLILIQLILILDQVKNIQQI